MNRLLKDIEEKGFYFLLKVIVDIFLILAGLFFINRFITMENKINSIYSVNVDHLVGR